ncbi:hypothetical protein EVG20_g3216 [Dentipellis fragilis]|uniref:TSEN34 N-terminal domain-containing protein n=1 Tax=Dentipellis fragilis TaxID=205917 RepID=A0A4Y9Z3Q2_9AGAM|nr:hypothetical protein EVG20_g3216 [Dentipellis fragilis]
MIETALADRSIDWYVHAETSFGIPLDLHAGVLCSYVYQRRSVGVLHLCRAHGDQHSSEIQCPRMPTPTGDSEDTQRRFEASQDRRLREPNVQILKVLRSPTYQEFYDEAMTCQACLLQPITHIIIEFIFSAPRFATGQNYLCTKGDVELPRIPKLIYKDTSSEMWRIPARSRRNPGLPEISSIFCSVRVTVTIITLLAVRVLLKLDSRANMSVQKVPIHVSNKRAFIWDVDHAAILRSQYRICGVLAGTLPHLSQQNAFLGLPLVLMPEEVVFLVEKEFAVLVDDPPAHRDPTPEELKKWDALRQLDIKQQHERLEHEASTKEDKSQSEAAIRKRQEREEKRRKAEELARKAADPNAEVIHESVFTPPSQPSAPESASSPSNTPYTVTVPAPSDAFDWFVPDEHTYSTLESAKALGIWDYPENEDERAKCEVFRDLWEKGNYMGGGSIVRVVIGWYTPAILCDIIRISSRPYNPPPPHPYVPWRSWHMDDSARPRKRPISYAGGTQSPGWSHI